jgi:Domain of unknown function (DUF4397)
MLQRRSWWAAPVLVSILVSMPATIAVAQARGTATVTVLHALPEFTADVYVNGDLTLSGFEPHTATDPLELPAGEYTLEIRDVGAAPDSEPALSGTVDLEGGQNLSIIAGLTVEGEAALNVFDNDVTRVAPGRSRLVVRNVADVASFGVRLDGDLVFRRVPNSDEAAAEVRAGVYEFEGTLEGAAAVGPEELVLEEGTAGIVYTVGSTEAGTLSLMFQTIQGLDASPSTVLTGTGGLASPSGFPVWATAAMAAALLGVVGSSAALIRRRGVARRLD